MEFDKSKVYTALNADESLIGAKGYFADTVGILKEKVEHNNNELLSLDEINTVALIHHTSRFQFFYLVEPALEKFKVIMSSALGLEIVPKNYLTTAYSECEGTEDECKQYISEYSRPKYRPFKDCDELIETYEKKTGFEAVKHLNMPTIWVKHKNGSNKYLIIAMTDNVVVLYNSHTFDMQELFEQYTFLDGSHCGVEC